MGVIAFTFRACARAQHARAIATSVDSTTAPGSAVIVSTARESMMMTTSVEKPEDHQAKSLLRAASQIAATPGFLILRSTVIA